MAPRRRELLLLRHGIAEERDPVPGDQADQADRRRSLTPEGAQRTAQLIRRLGELDLGCDVVLSSPLRRARQTAELAVAGGLAPDLELAAALAPLADPLPLLERWLGPLSPRPGWRRLALVGHEPDATPWQRLLGPVLSQALTQADGPLPALVAGADPGPLLWVHQSQGWLLGTRTADPILEPVQQALAADGYSLSPLESRGRPLQVWTRLQSRPVKSNPDQLQAELAGARELDGSWAWWGQGLAVLQQQHEGRQPPEQRLSQLQALATPDAPFQWAMDAATAQALLPGWTPWRLLTTLSSTPLTPAVDGAALSLERDPVEPRALRLQALLQLGR